MERQPVRRRRPALSCIECRRRKIRCDRHEPCRHCVTTQSQCSYKTFIDEHGTQQQFHRRSSVEAGSSTLPSRQALTPEAQQSAPKTIHFEHNGYLFDASIAAVSTPSAAVAKGVVPQEPSPQTIPRSFEADANDLLRQTFTLEKSSASELGDIEARLSPQSGLQSRKITLNKTRTLRWSHKLGIAPEVPPS